MGIRIVIRDKSGEALGVWIAKTRKGLNKKQQKEVAQARKDAGLIEGKDLVVGYYKRHGIK